MDGRSTATPSATDDRFSRFAGASALAAAALSLIYLVLGPAALAGVIVGPLWCGWVGWLLLTGRASSG